MNRYDVIVIGGGPAGLMAAAAAGSVGVRVLLVEKGPKLGRKLIISGGGRCNVTNRKEFAELVKWVPGNGRFLYKAFARFGSEEIIRFFEALGIRLKEEDHGRMFPVTDKAITVANALVNHIRALGVEIRLHQSVLSLMLDEHRCKGVILGDGAAVEAEAVVVAVGGTSVPQTGSTGDGYPWARAAGHTITPLYPTEVPLRASDDWIRHRVLQGLSLQAISLTLNDPEGKRLTVQHGDIIFTHLGLSGPAALRTSHYVSVAQMKWGQIPLHLAIDLFPDRTSAELRLEIGSLTAAEPKKAIKNVLHTLLPVRMIPLLLDRAGIPGETTHAHLPKDGIYTFIQMLKAFPVSISGTGSLEEAFVTGGGVSIKEIDPGTMQSRLKQGLFFAGEVIDVHAHTGGYNISVAFATGHVAGLSAAGYAMAGSTGRKGPVA